MSNTKTSRVGSIIAFVVSGLFVLLAVWVFLNRQFILDQLAVWSYTPSSSVASITERVGFTDKGEFIFYATKPEVAAQDSFNTKCPRQETGSPILGCYTTDDRIYVYDLTNKQLAGMEEVTAAHEMLHAVWYRTSAEDKEKLTAQLKAAYAKLDTGELKDRMDYYERTEPGEFVNELHSILGTEVTKLDPALEAYYNQFFDRKTVLELHQQYSSVYNKLYDRADELYGKMDALATSIETRSSEYERAVTKLSADINSFNARANSGSFQSQSQFNNERASLIQRTNALDAERNAINKSISTYNTYYNEYQEIASQIEVLNDSIDSFKKIEQTPSV